MDLIVTVPDEKVAFFKRLFRELNLPYKVVKTKPAKTTKQRERNVTLVTKEAVE